MMVNAARRSGERLRRSAVCLPLIVLEMRCATVERCARQCKFHGRRMRADRIPWLCTVGLLADSGTLGAKVRA